MFSDNESLAFYEEDTADGYNTPAAPARGTTPVKMMPNTPSGSKPPLPKAPPSISVDGSTPLPHAPKKTPTHCANTSDDSIQFTIDTPAPPPATKQRARSHSVVSNNSIQFHIVPDDVQPSAAAPPPPHKSSRQTPENSIMFRTEGSTTGSAQRGVIRAGGSVVGESESVIFHFEEDPPKQQQQQQPRSPSPVARPLEVHDMHEDESIHFSVVEFSQPQAGRSSTTQFPPTGPQSSSTGSIQMEIENDDLGAGDSITFHKGNTNKALRASPAPSAFQQGLPSFTDSAAGGGGGGSGGPACERKTVVSNRLRNSSNGSSPARQTEDTANRRRRRRVSRSSVDQKPLIDIDTNLANTTPAANEKEEAAASTSKAGGSGVESTSKNKINMPKKRNASSSKKNVAVAEAAATEEDGSEVRSPRTYARTQSPESTRRSGTQIANTDLPSSLQSQPRDVAAASSGHPVAVSAYVDPTTSIRGAVAETESWRLFNEEQRAELNNLKRRIAMAKRQDRTILEKQEAEPRPEPPLRVGPAAPVVAGKRSVSGGGGSYSARLSLGAPQPRQAVTPLPRSASSAPKPMPTTARSSTRRSVTPTARGSYHTYVSQAHQSSPNPKMPPKPTEKRSAAPRASATYKTPLRTPSQPAARQRKAAEFPLVSSTAEASVAQLLGIVWPPTRPNILFFVTGSRLTQQQVHNFYEAVAVQHETDQLHQAQRIMSPTQLRRLSQRPSQSVTSSVAVSNRASVTRGAPPHSSSNKKLSRSSVLREVFDTLDLNRRGMIHLSEIPTLQHLVSTELYKIERRIVSLGGLQAQHGGVEGGGHICSERSLIESAVAQRKLYECAWTGLARERNNGSLPRVPLHGFDSVDAPIDLLKLQRQALIFSFATNVLLPLLASSHISTLDFATASMVMFAAVGSQPHSGEGETWRQIVSLYFDVLS